MPHQFTTTSFDSYVRVTPLERSRSSSLCNYGIFATASNGVSWLTENSRVSPTDCATGEMSAVAVGDMVYDCWFCLDPYLKIFMHIYTRNPVSFAMDLLLTCLLLCSTLTRLEQARQGMDGSCHNLLCFPLGLLESPKD